MIISRGASFNFKILFFRVVMRLIRQKMAQNDKKFCLSHSLSQEPYIIWLWFLVHMCKMMISAANFFILQNFYFWSFLGGKRAKNDLKWASICFALYLRNCRSYYQDFDNDIDIYFLKCNIVNIKIILFFIGPLQQFFLIIICFSSSSINAKKKFGGVPHLLHMCVILLYILGDFKFI